MSKISEWRKSLNDIEDLDLSDKLMDKLLELDDIDIEMDHLSTENETLTSSLNDKDSEITKLKDTVWRLFENQTGISNQKTEEPKEQKTRSPKKAEDFIKFM